MSGLYIYSQDKWILNPEIEQFFEENRIIHQVSDEEDCDYDIIFPDEEAYLLFVMRFE